MTPSDRPNMTESKTEPLLEFVLASIAPMLLTGITDMAAARLAARQAIDGYAPRDSSELIVIAQILGFGLAALDDLRLSSAADLPLPMKLRLRSNASALGRAARQAADTLEKSHRTAVNSEPEWQEAPTVLPDTEPGPVELPPAPDASAEQQRRHQWAAGMTAAAAQLHARAGHVAPAQRYADDLWVEVLTDVAGEFRQPSAQAAIGKADLLRTTTIASGALPRDLA